MARESGAAVLLATVAVNEKDFPPFKSQFSEDVEESDRRRIQTLLVAPTHPQSSARQRDDQYHVDGDTPATQEPISEEIHGEKTAGSSNESGQR